MFYLRSLFVLHIIGLVEMQEWSKLNCPAPRSPQNGVSFIFEDGLKVQYRCHPGFIMRGRHFSECKHNKWDSPPPFCVRATTFEDPMSTPDKVAVSSSRTRFNWELDGMEPKHISIRYGNGSNRLPLINGLWKHPSTHSDSRVLSITLDSSLPHSIPPKQLVDQEVAIATLRQKVEQEVKSSRHIIDKNDSEKKLNHPHYLPIYANADGFVLGISNSNKHPVYHLGALADSNWNNYHTSRYLEPEMVELRRKQIEEARNIQMSAAHKRQQNKFNNIVTYSSRDIPVWQGRIKPRNRYGDEKTIYKSTRVETNRQKSPVFPKSVTMAYEMKTINQPKYSSKKVNEEKYPTEMHKILKISTIPLLTEDIVIPTIPAPLSEVFDLEQLENNTSILPQAFTLASNNKKIEMQTTKKPDPLEWPPEALWFKQTAKPTPKLPNYYKIPIIPKQKSKKNKSSRKKLNKGLSQRKNGQKSHPAPPVIFSHGRVKSTNLKNLRTK